MAIVGLLMLGALNAEAGPQDKVVHLNLEGVVDPFEASYLSSGIERANRENASAVLLTIDTPGGLDSSMRTIVQSILNSQVPVIGYASPQGARAASAGTFILMACPVAAMAPGTNVGAAHPVGVSGAIEATKATNDAVAYIRSLAEQRDRNPEWAEKAVRDSASVSAGEALRLKVIDLVSPSIGALLSEVDGREVTVAGDRSVRLSTSGASIVERDLSAAARLLHPLFNPNLAFVFFYAGLALIVVELLHPGLSIPGILGVLLLVLAGTAFGMLPIQLVGLVLLVASVGFFLLELKNPGIGLASAGGLIALVLGGLFLFDPSVPNARVSPGVILPVAVALGLFFAFVVKAALRTRRLTPANISQSVLGAEGYVTTELDPSGVVHVSSESWSAESPTPLPKGQRGGGGRRVDTQGRTGSRRFEPHQRHRQTEGVLNEGIDYWPRSGACTPGPHPGQVAEDSARVPAAGGLQVGTEYRHQRARSGPSNPDHRPGGVG
jgi:membrane-bound serine protease (ClpP class)